MEDADGGYLDPRSGRLIAFGRPASHPELWIRYLDGARATYRRHAVESALDYDRVRDGTSTALFVAALELDGQVVGGLRAQGPYTYVEQAAAIEEWDGRNGVEELRRQIAERLDDGVIEIKAVWVDRDAARHHEITDAIARVIPHSLVLMDVRYAFCTAAAHAIPRWQSTGGVVSADVAAVAYPDERYRTSLIWWDRESVFELIADDQIPALARESSQLPSWLATELAGSPSAAA